MITVSLCMIVKNEEDVLARCLDSVKDLVDEIIIVDTGSKDRTKEIAHTYTDNVFDFVWIDTPKPYLSIISRHFLILQRFFSSGIYGSLIAPVPIIHGLRFRFKAFSKS